MSAEILQVDAELRATLTRLQQLQARRNEASKLIGQAKAKKDEAQAQALMAEVAGLKEDIQKGEEEQRILQAALNDRLAELGESGLQRLVRSWGPADRRTTVRSNFPGEGSSESERNTGT